MRTKGTLVHLDDICKEFDILLLDTSALVRPLDIEYKGHNLIDRIKSKRTERDSSIFFNKCLKNKNNLFITKEVFDECYREEVPPIRDVLSKYDNMKISKKERKYFGEICSAVQERNNLLKNFKKSKRIITLNDSEKEKYKVKLNKNLYLKKKTYGKEKKKISYVDYGLLIMGATLSATRGNTAVLSNDFPLFYSYQALLAKGHLNPTKFGFFLRIKQDFFSRGKFLSNS